MDSDRHPIIPEPTMRPVPSRNWKADCAKLEAFLVSLGYGHKAIKKILGGEK